MLRKVMTGYIKIGMIWPGYVVISVSFMLCQVWPS